MRSPRATTGPTPVSLVPTADPPRFLSEAACHDIADRLARYAKGGGHTLVSIVSSWRGNVRWARNQIATAGEDCNQHIVLSRNIRGAGGMGIEFNEVTDEALVAALRRAERIAQQVPEEPDADLMTHYHPEPATVPRLFFETTYQLSAGARASAAHHLAQASTAAGMLSAGYIEVSARSQAFITSWGMSQYFQYTWGQYSTTVRDPKGIGSGWAGMDSPDWSTIDGERLSAIALEKCLQSRNPVAIEPGRYTTILEPQAVCDCVGQLMFSFSSRGYAEQLETNPFHKSGQLDDPFTAASNRRFGYAQLGDKVVDERITISADPMDPALGFPPFDALRWPADLIGAAEFQRTAVYHPATWIERGVLVNLAADRKYSIHRLGRPLGMPNSGAFRMTGGTTSVAEMIRTTKRGVLVTRFDQVDALERKSMLYRGYTRDGLWLIENGAISKPIKNLVFTESILFALNNVEELGPPQRVFHPPDGMDPWSMPQPVIVPPLKIRDFSFTALTTAI